MAAEHLYRRKFGDDNAEKGEQRREECCPSKERGGGYERIGAGPSVQSDVAGTSGRTQICPRFERGGWLGDVFPSRH